MRRRISILQGRPYLGRGGKLRRVEAITYHDVREPEAHYSTPDSARPGQWILAGSCSMTTMRKWVLREAVPEELNA